MFSGIRYGAEGLKLLDQRFLPLEEKWLVCNDLESVAQAIETMVVRGAPAIAGAAAFGLVLFAKSMAPNMRCEEFRTGFSRAVERLRVTRPTAVNLFHALEEMSNGVASIQDSQPISDIVEKLEGIALALFKADLDTCNQIGQHGLGLANGKNKVRVLTHCNTGALATAGYGTALGVIRSLHAAGKLEHVYVDETRPYMQGSRLTAYELTVEGIPFELICDSAAAFVMQQGLVDVVVVGADRIVSNGDTANKIGTYSVAVNARYHNIPFYIAAPLSTFDSTKATGVEIPVEMRDPEEVTKFHGKAVAPLTTKALNPSFDVTPGVLITGIITEVGTLRQPFVESIANALSR